MDMLKKMALLSIFFLVIGIAFGFSQAQQNIPYVDIPSAEAEIAVLEQENSGMETQSQQSQQEINSLENEIEQLQKRINEIDFILDRVKAKGSDLYEIYSDIVDKDTKNKAKATIDKNRELRTELEAKKKENQAVIDGNMKKIAASKKQITINTNKISRNKDRANLLSASIEKTRTQTQVLASYIESVDEINAEAEAVLNE